MLGATLVGERFELLYTAGTGGMGTVYRAIDHSNGNTVAVKVLLDSGAESISRFANEAQVLARLEHPHIVRYVTHGLMASGKPFLAMEWLDGVSLADRLKQGPLSVEETLALAHGVASALGIAHARGYVHRDIKPSNLFLAGGDVRHVKLLDFGIARLDRVTNALTKTGMMIGTPGYMAPEQAKGDRRTIDARADIFSLGCVLFECLSGKPAFHGVHVIALLAKLLLEEPPHVRDLRPDVPQALDELIHRLLSKEPEQRPADGQVLADALNRLSSSDGARISLRPNAVEALTHTEKRLVSVVAVVPSMDEKVSESGVTLGNVPIPGKLLAEIRRAVQPFGAKIEEVANGMLIALLIGTGPATDQAANAARCALRLRLLMPTSPIILLTGRGERSGQLPVGEVFERAASFLDIVKEASDATARICIDDVTRALLDGRFAMDDEDGTCVLRAEQAPGPEARTLLGQPSPFVGRERELRNLLEFVEDALDEQRSSLVLVTAEAGAGKSRLRHEFIQRLQNAHPNMIIAIGRADSLGAGSAFALLSSAFRSSLGIATDEPVESRRTKLARAVTPYFDGDDAWRISGFLGEMIGIPFADEDDVRVRAARQNPSVMADQIQRAYVDFARAVTAHVPVLVVLEDLHWGDAPSVKLVDAALRDLSEKPYFVVAFARPQVHEVFPRLWAGRGAQAISLGGLPRRAAETLIKTILGESVDAKVMSMLVERAGGNAFYLEELIRAVSEGRGATLPESVLGMIEARISGLDPEARRILRAASIFGETFWMGGLRALLHDEFSEPGPDRIKELCQLELIVPRLSSRFSSEVEYGFRHALVREGAYAMLTNRDLVLGHALAGEWLEKTGEQDPMVLAEHFERGAMLEKAANYYAQATREALRGADFAAAIARGRKGLACGAEGQTRFNLFDALTAVYFLIAQYADCYESALSAMEIAGSDLSLAARALGCAACSAVFLGKLDAFGNLVPDLLRVTPEPNDVATFAQALYGVFITLVVAGQQAHARPYLARQKEITDPFRDTDLLVATWADYSRVFSHRELDNDLWRALEANHASAKHLERAGAREWLAITNAHLGLSYLQLGLFKEAMPVLDGVIALPDAGNLALLYATYYKCLLEYECSRFDDALELLGELAKNALATNDFVILWCSRLLIANLWANSDKLSEADAILDELGENNAFLPFLRARFLSIRSEIRRRQGHAQEAVRFAEESVKVGASGPRYNYGEDPLPLRLALALHALGDLDAARTTICGARDDLLARAAKIPDESVRQSYLENIGWHAQTMQLAKEWIAT
ncbi:MAG TPA: protein kinase [Polyangium sp.]|nr:protein kinase [Polyangium sp.]